MVARDWGQLRCGKPVRILTRNSNGRYSYRKRCEPHLDRKVSTSVHQDSNNRKMSPISCEMEGCVTLYEQTMLQIIRIDNGEPTNSSRLFKSISAWFSRRIDKPEVSFEIAAPCTVSSLTSAGRAIALTATPNPPAPPESDRVAPSSHIFSSAGRSDLESWTTWESSVHPSVFAISMYLISASSFWEYVVPTVFQASHLARPVISKIDGRLMFGVGETVTYLKRPYNCFKS